MIASKDIRTLGTKSTKAIARGRQLTQQKLIRLSQRIRGRVARNHTKANAPRHVFRVRITAEILKTR